MRRLRFSLITLIVAVNVAGVLVWANVRTVYRKTTIDDDTWSHTVGQGWPFPIKADSEVWTLNPNNVPLTASFDWSGPMIMFRDADKSGWHWNALVLDLGIALSILLLATLLTELLVRKLRKAKRHDE